MDGGTDIEGLIARVALRDRAAFSALYDATSAKLFGVCIRVLKDRGAAEEVLQEVYVKVWNRADRYRVTGHSPMTWLITIARNAAIDRLRATRPETEALEDIAVAAPGPDGEAAAIAASEARRIRDCLAELDADRAAAVRAVYLEGRSYAEMAERLAVPLNTMKTWLRRSLISLRECLSR
ncbi:sigma-70 family RNA polymerase sigma factor [Roseicyclus sp.]|uniref:sigma-70 family RNA polymerase sigma factor n=1 Tax=Roseicyclus sp. TaxID=1914329 RepID=UPI003F9FD2C9